MTSKDISKYQIENAIANIGDNDLTNNFVCVFCLSRKYIDSLRETAITFFHFKQAFGNKVKLRNFVNIWMVEDGVQDLDSTTCGIFQLYFYNNLFNPDENSKIQSKARLIKKMIETLLN